MILRSVVLFYKGCFLNSALQVADFSKRSSTDNFISEFFGKTKFGKVSKHYPSSFNLKVKSDQHDDDDVLSFLQKNIHYCSVKSFVFLI